MHSPYLSLSELPESAFDAELIRQVPRKLAYYHRLLPLSAEGSELSVAMADPGNMLVTEMIERLLNTTVVPVRSDGDEICAVLDRFWQYIPLPAPQILVRGRSENSSVQAVAHQLCRMIPASELDFQHEDMETLLRYTGNDSTILAVIDALDTEAPDSLIRQASCPLLLLYGAVTPEQCFRRVLFALRGHAPDLSALDWVIPIARANQASLSLLAVTAPPRELPTMRMQHSLATFLNPNDEPARHLGAVTERLNTAGLSGYLKLCQGDPFQQIRTEFSGGQYSLLVLVTEGYGEFVSTALAALQDEMRPHAVLIVKPTLPVQSSPAS